MRDDCQCSPECAEPCRPDRNCDDANCRCYQNWSMNMDLAIVPDVQLDLSQSVIAAGRQVVVLPCVNPALSPTLDVIGLPGWFWRLEVRDAFGTVLWTYKLGGREATVSLDP